MAVEGELTENEKCPDCGAPQPIKVLISAAGPYIGTACDRCGPDARLSDYFSSYEAAVAELAIWKEHGVRPSGRDTDFHPGPITQTGVVLTEEEMDSLSDEVERGILIAIVECPECHMAVGMTLDGEPPKGCSDHGR